MTDTTPQDWRVRWAAKQAEIAAEAPSTPLAPPTVVAPTPVDDDPFGDERDDEDFDDDE